MEDGSALTPLIANHIVAPSAGNVSPALLHLRLLARLSDCPVYLGAPSKGVGGNGIISNNASVQPAQHQLANNGVGSGHGGSDIETRTNALTIECLRQKPIEQIMQRIPLDLLHFDQTTGDISMPAKWLRMLSQVSQTSNIAPQNYSIDSLELSKLISAATRLKLEKEEPSAGNGWALQDGGFLVDHLRGSSEASSELFGAIFGQPSASMQPIFGPIMDGTMVPNEDISSAMLKPGSTFAQRDLLIGLSQPSIIKHARLSGKSAANQGQQAAREDGSFEFRYRPDHSIAERITSQLQQTGLSSEPAVEMINVFVRSFYRHHNQEISNSIINHYLNGQSNNGHRLRPRKRIDGESNPNGGDSNTADQERRLLVLDSVLQMFQDALTSVPVLKTALIHATKQLDSLLEAFVGQEFDRWSQLAGNSLSSSRMATSESFTQQYHPKSVLESFTRFAKALFGDPDWPLELRSPVSSIPAPSQPKSTYLYQLDSRLVIGDLQGFATKQANEPASSAWFQRAISDTLSALFVDIKNDNYQVSLSAACALDFSLYESDLRNKPSLISRFQGKLCARFALLLARFASKGKIDSALSRESESSRGVSLKEKLSRHETRCISGSDAHLVQPAEPEPQAVSSDDTTSRPMDARACQSELESLALDHLVEEYENFIGDDSGDPMGASRRGQQWTTFDLFTQQVASLVVAREPALLIGSISHDDSSASQSHSGDPKSTLLARSSFWLNFIPALNCTRTLPITPNNPLVSVSSSSLLLNLNLQFNCQRGARTVYNMFEYLVTSIKQQLEARISHWIANRSSSSSNSGSGSSSGFSQNQQTLSVSNMSKSDEGLGDQQGLQLGSEEQPNSYSNHSLKPSLPVDDLQGETIQSIERRKDASNKAFMDLRSRYIGMVLLICSLFIGLILGTGACSVLQKRHTKSTERRRQRKQANQSCVDHPVMRTLSIDCESQRMLAAQHSAGKPYIEEPSNNSHHQVAVESEPDIAFALDPNNYHCEEPRVQLEPCELVEQHHHQLQDLPVAESNHVCTVGNQENNFVCWTADNDYLDGVMSLCRSHSSLSGANVISEHEQPIMLPILSKPSSEEFHSRVTFEQECLTNCNIDTHYGGSSSETPAQSSGSPTVKKRVKISDPLATERRTTNRSRVLNAQDKHQERQRDRYPANSKALYCPIHRNQSSSTMNLASSAASSSYYVDDGATFIAANDLEPWNNAQFGPVMARQYQRRNNRPGQGRPSNSSFGVVCEAAQSSHGQQVVPNGYIFAPPENSPQIGVNQTTNPSRIQ